VEEVLHTVNKSPFLCNNLRSCLRLAQKDNPILLYEDGVYCAMLGTEIEPLMIEALKKHPIYALQADLKARGIIKLLPGINIIDYSGFVGLVEQHKVCSWI
jgi:tRNA 2-thiouridine synthesizing protein B